MPQEIWIYDVISTAPGDVSAKVVRDELAKLNKRDRLTVRINSPGGDVAEAVASRSLLAEWQGGVDVIVDGLAASAASYIATVGRTVAMAEGSMLMIHDAWSVVIGDSAEMAKAAETLDAISDVLVGAYVAKSGKSRKEIRDAMKAETWLTAAGAVEFGLADVMLGADGQPVAARGMRKVAACQRSLDTFRAIIR